jgi:hypothetical protein
MRLSKVAMKRLVLLVLAIACLVPAMPAAAPEPDAQHFGVLSGYGQ